MKAYDEIFTELLAIIDPNKLKDKDYYNQTEQYDEDKGRRSFLENHQKGNIIQKLFLIPKEEKIFCKKCHMKPFRFNYSQFIVLKNSQMNLLNQTFAMGNRLR